MSVGVNDPAHRTVLLRARLPLDAYICTTERPQSLHKWGVGVILSVLQAWNKIVAARAHSLDLWIVHLQVKLVFVRLNETYAIS